MEIERKFLLENLSSFELINSEKYEIFQGYLSVKPVIRLRKSVHNNVASYKLTYKGEGLLAREEIETTITEDNFNQLRMGVKTNWIHKYRYKMMNKGDLYEIDEFLDELSGLFLLEIEFPSLTSSEAFIPSFDYIKEVTSDPLYQNSSLINYPRGYKDGLK